MTTSPKSDEYLSLSRRYIRQAEAELERGDTVQAGEKAWGAVSTALKSIAEQRGWFHNHHDLTIDAMGELATEFDRQDLQNLFDNARAMHQNFYEDLMPEDEVSIRLSRVNRLLQELEALRTEPQRPFIPQSSRQRRRQERLTGQPWDSVPPGESPTEGS